MAADGSLSVEITDLNHRGEGVGRWQGQVVFVRGAVPGDVVRVRPLRPGAGGARYGRARLEEVLVPSPHRVRPACEVAHRCGGCQLQALAYPAQLAWKQRMVQETLRRVGHLEAEVAPTLGMDNPWGYRNKAIFPLGRQRGRIVAGCFEPGTHRVVDVAECRLQHPLNNRVLEAGRRLLQEMGVPVYDENADAGFARHIVSRVAVSRGEGMAVLVTRHRRPRAGPGNRREEPGAGLRRGRGRAGRWPGELPRRWMAAVPELVSVYQNINPRRTNVIMGEEDILLEGKPSLEDRLLDLSFTVSPRSFYQVNPAQAEVMYRLVQRWAALDPGDEALDIYSGVGTITLVLARAGARVTGVEEVPEAVADARRNAVRNGLQGARFLCGQAEKLVPGLLDAGSPAVVVLDPPRQGVRSEVLAAITRARPPRLVYVSCAPATLARDLAVLVAGGYRLVAVQPIDMFPQTAHVEVVTLLERGAA